MRIGILGQPCIDEIVHSGPRGEQVSQTFALGGVLYSLAAAERLIRECGSAQDGFVPLMWRSETDEAMLSPLIAQFEHINEGGLWPTLERCNRVQLVYDAHGNRTEHCPHILPSLSEEQLTSELLSSLDAIFINMISGFDVSLETLEAALASAEKRPYVHLDIHALILGSLSHAEGESGPFGEGRKPHGVKNWRRWLALADTVQMNELELRWLADPEITTEHHLLKVLELREHPRPKNIIITRAEKGASLFDLETGNVHHVAPPTVKAVETTGSGDVFGAAFIFFLMSGRALDEALHEAVHWATWNTTLKTIDDILSAPLLPSNY